MEVRVIGEYEDDYPTCEETKATLRIYFQEENPSFVTSFLGIEPTKTQKAGEPAKYRGKPMKNLIEINGWFLSSEGLIFSLDARRHIDYIVEKLIPMNNRLQELRAMGALVDLVCFWRSADGHGGPILSPRQLSRLADLEISIWFDFYS